MCLLGPALTQLTTTTSISSALVLIPFENDPPVVRRFAVIGTAATIGAGVEVGRGAIVAPGAMATKDVAPWTIVAGVPARELRSVDEDSRAQILAHFGLNDEASA